MRPGQLRQHARLLLERYSGQNDRDAGAARAQAALLIAEAELAEAKAGKGESPEEDCAIRDIYPIIGEISRRGGEIINVQHPWDQTQVDALKKLGVDMAFEWCHDPRAGLRQGRLIRIYIGTKELGPRAMWYDGIWTTHKSRGNYGKNWACGGNWSSVDCKKGDTLNDVAPDLARQINKIREDKKMENQKERIKKAEAKLAVAEKHILACSQRDMAACATKQSQKPIYPGQEIICAGKAARALAAAEKTEAEADLILAQAGL